MSGALETQGTLIQRGNGADPEVFTTIGEINSFQGPGGSASVIDVTSLDSAAKEKRMGLMDEGQFTFEMNLVPGDTAQDGLRSDRTSRTLRNFKLTLVDSTVITFAAYVTGFSISGGVDDKIGGSVTLEISGSVTWA